VLKVPFLRVLVKHVDKDREEVDSRNTARCELSQCHGLTARAAAKISDTRIVAEVIDTAQRFGCYFGAEELDLVWSEGAIYNIGFERGLTEWRQALKPGGYIAVSEASWFTDERPAEIDEFWMQEYPGIDTIPNKVLQMQEAGYVPIATFVLPENCWTDNYYVPQVKVQQAFLEEHADNSAAVGFIESMQHEAEMYDKYKQYYGYAFYIGKKLA